MNFKEVMADQGYKANKTAAICQNCANLEEKSFPIKDERPSTRIICGVGRFFVRNSFTCNMFESK